METGVEKRVGLLSLATQGHVLDCQVFSTTYVCAKAISIFNSRVRYASLWVCEICGGVWFVVVC